ncbi:MAG: hypothetical protein ACKODL_05145, partial [Phenylobacterium sp.]
PSGPSHPDLFLLCSSPETADFAGRAGVGMVFAEFIARADGAPAVSAYRAAFAPSACREQGWAAVATIALAAETADFAGRSGVGMVFAEFIARADGAPAVSAYRAAFAPSAFRTAGWAGVATIALAAETAEAAERLAAPMRASALAGLDGPGADGERPRFARIEDALAFLEARRDDPRLAGVTARAIVGDPETVRRGLAQKAEATGADELFVMAVGPDLESRVRSLELIKAG